MEPYVISITYSMDENNVPFIVLCINDLKLILPMNEAFEVSKDLNACIYTAYAKAAMAQRFLEKLPEGDANQAIDILMGNR